MKRVICTFFCLLTGLAMASVQVRISDPNTLEPIDLTEIMVGSRIALVVHSDTADFWSGGVFIEESDRALGLLTARDKDPNSRDWSGSHLSDAGPEAYVTEWKDSLIWGFEMYPDNFERSPGNWFVIDYYAAAEGPCSVNVYDYNYSWTIPDPNLSVVISNTPTRDIKPDGFVNLADFMIFSTYWLADDCSDPNNSCYAADFSRNGSVGFEDVILFADYWLHGNPGWKPAEEKTPPSPAPAESDIATDVIYTIADANSLSEITLEIGESTILYIVKSSIHDETFVFNTEVNLSDPNAGWIDSAQILAMPRMDTFDFIGAGSTQYEGIEFFAANIGASMLDGDMAAFVYTAAQTGDVTLSLIDYTEPAAKLGSITIHQVEPVVQQLQRIYDESPELQEDIPEPEWNEFIQNVEQAETL
jgi:hypothetical protein